MDALPEIIETERLTLSLPREDCAEQVAALMTPDVSRWLASWPSAVSASEVRERIGAARAARAAGTEAIWLVQVRGSGDVAGWIRVVRESVTWDRGELGYWIGQPFHGQGYATEAARAVLTAVFDGWRLSTVESGAQVDNDASFGVMRKLGMTPAGERMVWAATRGRDEICRFFVITRAQFDGGGHPKPGMSATTMCRADEGP
jgi:ribosomal-protein-alanine N-acetyltransferase